jgi:sulfite dehydrogenase (cytochrome) subunit B
MKKLSFLVATLLAGLAVGTCAAVADPYKLPPETATLRPGPNQDVAAANCIGCHSSDYIATQPKGEKFKSDFWKAEVIKMIKVYGAPIEEADVPKIVEYLTEAYGDSNHPAVAPAAAPASRGKPAKSGPAASR